MVRMIDKMVKQLCMDVPESSLRSRACARTDLMVRLVDKMVKQSCMDVLESIIRRSSVPVHTHNVGCGLPSLPVLMINRLIGSAYPLSLC